MIRFDDFFQDQWAYTVPIFQNYGMKASFVIIEGSCRTTLTGVGSGYIEMSWQQVEQLHLVGHFNGSHHDTSGSSEAQPSTIAIPSLLLEAVLVQHNINDLDDFVFPYGQRVLPTALTSPGSTNRALSTCRPPQAFLE